MRHDLMINPGPVPPVRVGIDLGGTKTEIIAMDERGRELVRRREATPSGDYEGTLQLLAGLVGSVRKEVGSGFSIGIGMPGAQSRITGAIRNANSTCLNGRQFKRDIEILLGQEVRIGNDANCFALSEAVDGAGRGMRCVFGVILGTGVGGGIVIDGALLTGANAIAGEWGHNPLPGENDLPLPQCYCGRSGCIETYLSGPGMSRDHLGQTGERLAADRIVAGANAGNAGCMATLARYEERLARALSGVVNLIDPDVIVLGGGVSRIDHLYEQVPALWRPHIFSDSIETRLLPNVHGDSSGVRGAAWLWNAVHAA